LVTGVSLLIFAIFSFSFFWLHESSASKHDMQTSGGQSKKYGVALGDTLFWMNKNQVDAEMGTISKLGTNWIRVDLSWQDVQPDKSAKYDWAGFDRIVASANKHKIHVLPILAYTPKWARPASCDYSQQCAPAKDEQFAAFASEAVKRYAPQGV